MFKRVRQLRISLAAKCQLLFGAAVVLIISAALFVPWYRMEQLMEQLNQGAASTLAEQARAEHIRTHTLALAGSVAATLAPPPSTLPTLPTTLPSLSTDTATDAEFFPEPRLVAVGNDALPAGLTSFELRAINHLKKNPDTPFYFRYYDGNPERYRYAEPLYLAQSCVSCHGSPAQTAAVDEATVILEARGKTPATRPVATNQPVLMGIVSVDIPSRIKANQPLLNRVFILVAGLLAGTLAVIVFYLIITRLILQPVRVLQETAEKVSQGDLNIRSDISTGDEFQQLSETFNTMLTNLKRSADQLRAVNKSLDLKLGQLAETNVALYESNRLKSEFLANVSHELRTPLNSILGFAELVRDASSTPPDAKTSRYIQNIINAGQNLLDLINDLLDLAKIEAGRMEVRPEPLSLSDVFEGLANLIKPLTESKKLAIESTVDADVPIVTTDPAKLQQILYNFLSNAIKFSPEAGAIELTARLEDDAHVRIAVTDRGPGIEPDKQQVIFEKFRQIDGSVTRQHSGSGLGLAISRELTQLLSGTIGVVSTPGEGAAFWVCLPLKIEPSDQDVREKMVMT